MMHDERYATVFLARICIQLINQECNVLQGTSVNTCGLICASLSLICLKEGFLTAILHLRTLIWSAACVSVIGVAALAALSPDNKTGDYMIDDAVEAVKQGTPFLMAHDL